MSTTAADKPASLATAKSPQGASERRRRKRAKIAAQLRARPAHAPNLFEDVCKTVDVSRDGLLFTAGRKDYAVGLRLEIIFPYSPGAHEFNQPQMAEVVRVSKHPDGTMTVAVEFLAAREQSLTAKTVAAKSGAPAAPATNSGKRERSVVLIVEPDARAGEALRAALQQDGYSVVIVETPRRALDILRTVTPAVVIADVESPEISGHDLCVVIKRDERLQGVPVILLTRAAQPADYSASHSLGAVICMAKPYKMERLLHVVKLVAPPVIRTSYSSSFGTSSVNRQL